MGRTQTPSPTHDQFDRLTAPIEEFEYLPEHPASLLQLVPDDDYELDDHQPAGVQFDRQILAGLVSPV